MAQRQTGIPCLTPRFCWVILAMGCATVGSATNLMAQQSNHTSSDDSMLSMLLLAVEENPEHSDSWRLLGKVYQKRGDRSKAREAFEKSLQILPTNPAAHFDLGHLLIESGEADQGHFHHARVIELAPESEYARRLTQSGFQAWVSESEEATSPPNESGIATEAASDSSFVEQTSYQLQTFDGSDDLQRRAETVIAQDMSPEPNRLSVVAETGVLHNSNVTLTPISRELAILDLASAQWIGNIETEWMAWQAGDWRFGTIGRGYFTANESHMSDFNLQSYHGGTYLSRDLLAGEQYLIGRIEYVYSLDQFAGVTLGDQHLMTTSLTQILSDSSIVYSYASIGVTQFDDDGIIPQTDSLDGLNWSIGSGRYFPSSWDRLDTWSIGMDYQFVDTEGDNFRYQSISTYASTDWILRDCMTLELTGGIGFRDYLDFALPGGRDEWTWRVGTELIYEFRPNMEISFVANYDRFSSENDAFDVDRLTAGILTTLTRR